MKWNACGGIGIRGCRVSLETSDTRSGECGTESEPAFLQRLRIQIIHDTFAIDIKPRAPGMCTFYFDMIPVIGSQQMGRIGVFLQNGRSLCGIFHPSLITCVTAETGGRIMIAAIAQIIHLQGIAIHEDTTAPASPRPEILGMRIGSQPEAVQVAQTVTWLPFIHHTGIILHSHPLLHLLLAPQRQPLRR